MLKPLPFALPDELMMVHLLMPDRAAPAGVFREMVWSYPKYEVFRDEQQVFSEHALFTSAQWSLTGNGEPERLRGEVVGARYLTTLGTTPVVGRDFSSAEDRTRGIDGIVMLGHALWQRRFGGDPNLLGQVVRLSGVPYTVVGILPPGFRGLTGEADAWIPLMTLPAEELNQKWSHSYYAVARRKAGVSDEQARSAVTVIGQRIDAAIPDPRGVSKYGAMALALQDSRVDPLIRRSALVLDGVMAQSVEQRTREIGVRMALGAERRNIFALVISRALVIAAVGIVVGVGLSLLSMRFLETLLYQVRPNDPITLGVLAAGLLGVCLLASYIPARRATRVDPWTSLRAD